MCKRLMYLVSVVLLVLSSNTMAQIDPASVTDGHVYLFEDVGADVTDDSANNNAGNLLGDPQIVAGLNGMALQFDGIDDGVHIPDSALWFGTSLAVLPHARRKGDVQMLHRQLARDQAGEEHVFGCLQILNLLQ